MVEVFVETEGSKLKSIDFRATHARFDKQGKADLHHAAEAIAVILEGHAPKKCDEDVLDISSILRTSEYHNRYSAIVGAAQLTQSYRAKDLTPVHASRHARRAAWSRHKGNRAARGKTQQPFDVRFCGRMRFCTANVR